MNDTLKMKFPPANELFFQDGWGGGKFSLKGKMKPGMKVDFYLADGSKPLGSGTLMKGRTVYGFDYDMGHEYPWHFQDWDVVMEHDTFNRRSSLLEILKGQEVMVIAQGDL